ncbi:DNA-directed RNA polymerase subunit D [Candidatus Micrarchaeota archaeon CG_4_10_14_0_2_um_filter_55_9]|nr:MAG: hypothetical protein AUJ15_03695 [Candidatus Micrarchaeota archaeon CG1_02_55_41]PIO02632.1 MAG: DNA-directed RNA polymerase subunit D [Candidatus Micrarchaeota archaeon CG09_land_8_20_14_0_10_55_25]PIZ92164.1 MAG: DNA-directed RNA polymerase subunit D [Candidatus Micrarchaeota archaeon CG_4_10_14_0_2_um_filter_55_9]PJD01466.1 MAG: DNA-directed RNA polymerase subunit D [Candidatus Micrarchaeota archaeon CG10_big_fil_rev_8_21_14_0_10_54_18]
MKIDLLKDEGSKVFYRVTGAEPELLNALRRAIIADLPAFAVREVDFFENTSAVFNEYLANRIGLIPLTWEESLNEDAEIYFTLDAAAEDGEVTVNSAQLASQDEAIKVYCENIPIIKLGKGQKLRLQATADIGTGAKHARYQSAIASYGLLSNYKLSTKCKKCGAAIKPRLPQEAINKVNGKTPEQCGICFECESKALQKKPDAFKDSDGDYVFWCESYNNVPAKQQLLRGLNKVGEKIEELKTK